MNKTILLVEDEPDYRELLAEELQDEGFTVHAVATGEAALNLAKNQTFDLMILDLVLPGMDGIQLYHQLTNKLHQEIPTIILSNLTQAAHQADIAKYLIKANTPITEIITEVKKLLKST